MSALIQTFSSVTGYIGQTSLFQTSIKNWVTPVPERHEEGRAWIKMDVNGQQVHYHNETKDLYPADSNDWAVAKTIGIMLTGHYYYFFASVRHIGSGLIETAKSVKTVYDDYRVFKDQGNFSLKTFASTCIFGSKDQNSVFKPALGEFKQALKDVGAQLLFSFETEVRGIQIGAVLRACFIAYSFYAPLQSRVYFDKLETWWRPEGVRPLKDSEVANLSVWQTIDNVTKGAVSHSQLFKTNRIVLPKEEKVADVKVEQEEQVEKPIVEEKDKTE